MELFAVLCIETSERNGYNIPEIRLFSPDSSGLLTTLAQNTSVK
ncbi:unnamed protein product, partial [Leptidea sinapis]